MLFDHSIDYKAAILQQLQPQSKTSAGIASITTDYLAALKNLRELQIRNAQLNKEAGELREENETLIRAAETAKGVEINREELEASKIQVDQLQKELIDAYREKSASAEASATALRQLEIVREVAASQEIELQEAKDDIGRLKQTKAKMQGDAARLQQACDLASKEAESRTSENAKIAARNLSLERENFDLACRLVQMKDAEAERMNEMNNMIEETLANARQAEAAIIAEARAKAAAILMNARNGGSPLSGDGVESILGNLGIGQETNSRLAIPTKMTKSVPSHHAGCYAAAFDSPGGVLATCGGDKLVRLWDPLTMTQTGTLRGSHEGLTSIAFTNDGKFILGAEEKQAVYVWDIRSGRIRHSLTAHGAKVTDVACSPMDPDVAASCAADRTIKIWDLVKGVPQRTMVVNTCNSLSFTSSGGLVASGHVNGSLLFWDRRATSGQAAHEMPALHSGCITSVAAAANQELILTCGKDNTLRLIDTRTFKPIHRLSSRSFLVPGTWAKACLSPGARYAAAGSTDGTVIVWNIRTGAVENELRPTGQRGAGGGLVTACAWSPEGLPLVSCDKAGAVTFWGAG